MLSDGIAWAFRSCAQFFVGVIGVPLLEAAFAMFVCVIIFFFTMVVMGVIEQEKARAVWCKTQQGPMWHNTVLKLIEENAILDDAVPHVKWARDILHSELLQISGIRPTLAHAFASMKTRKIGGLDGAEGQRAFESIQLSHARQVLKISNDIANESDRAALRPLRLEAQKARLRMLADNRWIESELSLQAKEELRRRGGQNTTADPLQTAGKALAEAIDQRKADGEEVSTLEDALERVRCPIKRANVDAEAGGLS